MLFNIFLLPRPLVNSVTADFGAKLKRFWLGVFACKTKMVTARHHISERFTHIFCQQQWANENQSKKVFDEVSIDSWI